jgi:putative two-component system response regulator
VSEDKSINPADGQEASPARALVLVIDDSEDDCFLLKRAAQTAKISADMQCVRSGREAIDYFEGAGAYQDRVEYPLPKFVILDWNLPENNSAEVLRHLRNNSASSHIPVVVLTGCANDATVGEACGMKANACIEKPATFEKLTLILANLIATYLGS